LRDTAYHIVGCLGFGLDVTERVNSERERSQTLERLEKLNKERETLLGHLVRAEEAERKRIAEGIHDDSIQVMTSAGMEMDLLIDRLSEPDDVELARRSRDLVGDAIGRLRILVFRLRPLALDQAGLAVAARLLLKKATVETGLEFTLSDESTVPLGGEKLYVTYQIIQEAIANVRKHSGARRVDVTFRDGEDGLKVQVVDDGSGFDPATPLEHGHFGLTGMRERAAVLGGICTVTTSNEGTSIELWVPWDDHRPAQTVSG
jgi:signal transduction histidine kinase